MSYFYIYKLTHPITGEFYIGRRTSSKPAKEDIKYRGSSKSWYRELSKDEIENILIKEILNENINSKEELNFFEIEEISKNIKNPLCKNAHIPSIGYYTPGPRSEETKRKLSEHFTGLKRNRIVSEETRKKLSELAKRKRKPLSEETKKKLSIAGSERKLSEEHKSNLSKAWEERRKKEISKETRKKMSESRRGKKLSNETKKKLSNSLKGENNPMFGKKLKEESKIKISQSKRGKKRQPFSEETKARMAESARNRKRNKENND